MLQIRELKYKCLNGADYWMTSNLEVFHEDSTGKREMDYKIKG